MSSQAPDHKYVLVTGANSGLGFATCCRLLDEFSANGPSHERLTLVITTRSTRKSENTIKRLQSRIKKHAYASKPSNNLVDRISFHAENLELTSLISVYECAARLVRAIPKINVVILNAGIGGWIGNNWPLAWWTVSTDLVQAVTWPPYKLAPAGLVTEPQLPENVANTIVTKEPVLGQLFCANVFGHYVFVHQLLPLIRSTQLHSPARVIWISSIEACQNHFELEDLQGLRTSSPYESSKRLTDILALTSNLPSCKDIVASYLGLSNVSDVINCVKVEDLDNLSSVGRKINSAPPSLPTIHLAHPGVCATSVFPLPLILELAMYAAFYIARFLGSPWHTISAYLGATAPVWLAFVDQKSLDEEDKRRALWGSTTNVSGTSTGARRTDVEGWGLRGQAGEKWWGSSGSAGGRKRGIKEVTNNDIANFEELGRNCWDEMEKLRITWDKIMKKCCS